MIKFIKQELKESIENNNWMQTITKKKALEKLSTMNFKIGFEHEDRKALHKYWDKIFDNNNWSEGQFTKLFEEKCPTKGRETDF